MRKDNLETAVRVVIMEMNVEIKREYLDEN